MKLRRPFALLLASAMLVSTIAALAGCGTKGDLVLPPEDAAPQEEPARG